MKMVATITLVAALGAITPATAASKGPKPKLSMSAARAIALKVAPGRVKDAEYEREGGGWRYSFDIVQGGKIHEIGVDATSGRIVEDKYEAPGDKD